LNNPQLGYDANAHAGKRLLISGIITTAAAIVLYWLPGLTIDGYAIAMLFFGVGPLTIGLVQSFQYRKRWEG
jgi:hypothetical protein